MATNYRQIFWGGTTGLASSVKWVNGNTTVYPAVVKWNTTTVFARAMDVTMVTKTGITNIQYTFTAGDVSTDISRGAYGYFWGDTFTVTPTTPTWWTVTPASKTVVLNSTYFNLATSATPSMLYMRDFFTPSRLPRTLSVTGDSHAQVTGSYTNTNNEGATVTTKSTTTKTVTDAWQGATVTFTAAIDRYWKTNTSSGLGSKEPGSAALAASATSTRKLRTIVVDYDSTTMSSVSIQYVNSAGTSTASGTAASVSIANTYSGGTVTYSITGKQYYEDLLGTFDPADNENAITTPRNKGLARTLKLSCDAHSRLTVQYTNTNFATNQVYTTTRSASNVGPTDLWQGASCTIQGVRDAYYDIITYGTGTMNPGSSTLAATAVSSLRMRTIHFNVAATQVSYINSSGTSITNGSVAAGSNLSIWCGGDASWRGTTPAYTTMAPVTGSLSAADTSATYTYSPTISGLTRDVTSSITYTSAVQTGVRLEFKANCASYYGAGGLSNVTKAVVSGIVGVATWSNAAQGNATTITVTGIDNSYYTYSPAYVTVAAATATGTASFSITRRPRTVTVNAISTVQADVRYETISGTSPSVHISSNTTYTDVWCGAPVTVNYVSSSSVTVFASGKIHTKPFTSLDAANCFTTKTTTGAASLPASVNDGTVSYPDMIVYPYSIYFNPQPGRPTIYYGAASDFLMNYSRPASMNNSSGIFTANSQSYIYLANDYGIAWYAPVESYWTATVGISTTTYSYQSPGAVNSVISIKPTATKLTRTAGITRGIYWTMGVSSATMYYVSGTSTATTRTHSSIPLNATGNYDVAVWQGGTVTFSVTANSGWTFTTPAAIAAGTTTVRRAVTPYVMPNYMNATNLSVTCGSWSRNWDDPYYSGAWYRQVTITNRTAYKMTVKVNLDSTYTYLSTSEGRTIYTACYANTITVATGGTSSLLVQFGYDDSTHPTSEFSEISGVIAVTANGVTKNIGAFTT